METPIIATNAFLKNELAVFYDNFSSRNGPFLSLSPQKKCITPLPVLFEHLCAEDENITVAQALSSSLKAILVSCYDNFPNTIFWDMDYIAAWIYQNGPENVDEKAEYIQSTTNSIVELQKLYGRHSALNFQYIHDFTYGYDWLKWRSRQPDKRHGVLPFSAEFLRYLKKRAGELGVLISRNDAIYGKLHGGTFRNPFGFSRSRNDEIMLHKKLAAAKKIPVETWELQPNLQLDFTLGKHRESVAAELGLNKQNTEKDRNQ